ncbi:DoxX family membrane protein [Olleya aquimaris]|uniref:DoxX-like protein n=1 Tax=Olleya aquimaris TaxID=639310 RepID=A0A327RC97_9FLAO|nr:DoxX family membrane protein [Olleya aquimaris]RAJ14469.1 DoxX-like protein [Olleya aquimaris]
MNSKVFNIIRIVFGILLVVFGANKFLDFMPKPDSLPEGVITYMTGLLSTKTLTLVGIVEIVAGLTFIFNKFGALLAIILMSVSINAVLFHAFLDPANSIGAIVLLLLNIVVLYSYKDKYKPLLN